MVYAIAFEVLVLYVDVVKGQLDAIVHIKATLCLTDQTEVAVVDQYHHEWQMELRTHR